MCHMIWADAAIPGVVFFDDADTAVGAFFVSRFLFPQDRMIWSSSESSWIKLGLAESDTNSFENYKESLSVSLLYDDI